jgi:type II secretory pathway component GspD/PulD (secretin)
MQAMTKVMAVPDPRTNSVIVSAAANLMTQIERMVQQLDSDSSRKQKVFVYNLDNADVDNVATILRGMFESQSTMMNNRNNANRSGMNTNNQLNNRTVNQSNFSLGAGQNGN